MAKFKSGAMAGEVSGSIGGVTFSRGTYGPYIRKRAAITNTFTQAQHDVRQDFADISKEWRGLSDQQRTGFINVAPQYTHLDTFGDQQNLTGFNLFMKLRMQQNTTGALALIPIGAATVPQSIAAPQITAAAVDVSSLTVTIVVTPPLTTTNRALVVQATAQQGSGRKYIGVENYRQIKSIDAVVIALPPIPLGVEYENVLGDLAIPEQTEYVYFRARYVNYINGNASAWSYTRAQVLA